MSNADAQKKYVVEHNIDKLKNNISTVDVSNSVSSYNVSNLAIQPHIRTLGTPYHNINRKNKKDVSKSFDDVEMSEFNVFSRKYLENQIKSRDISKKYGITLDTSDIKRKSIANKYINNNYGVNSNKTLSNKLGVTNSNVSLDNKSDSIDKTKEISKKSVESVKKGAKKGKKVVKDSTKAVTDTVATANPYVKAGKTAVDVVGKKVKESSKRKINALKSDQIDKNGNSKYMFDNFIKKIPFFNKFYKQAEVNSDMDVAGETEAKLRSMALKLGLVLCILFFIVAVIGLLFMLIFNAMLMQSTPLGYYTGIINSSELMHDNKYIGYFIEDRSEAFSGEIEEFRGKNEYNEVVYANGNVVSNSNEIIATYLSIMCSKILLENLNDYAEQILLLDNWAEKHIFDEVFEQYNYYDIQDATKIVQYLEWETKFRPNIDENGQFSLVPYQELVLKEKEVEYQIMTVHRISKQEWVMKYGSQYDPVVLEYLNMMEGTGSLNGGIGTRFNGNFASTNVDISALSNADFASMMNVAEPCVNYVRYTWGGGPNNYPNMDCSGFVSYVLIASGVRSDIGYLTTDPLTNICTLFTDYGQAQPGDLIFFQSTDNGKGGQRTSHVGIVIGNGYMIHCSSSKGTVVETSYNTSYYQEHFYAFGRVNR